MKWITFEYDSRIQIGALTKDGKEVCTLKALGIDRDFDSMTDFIARVTDLERKTASKNLPAAAAIPFENVRLRAPILRPLHDILCVGVNYLDHQNEVKREMAVTKPERNAIYFSKRALSLTGSGEKPLLDPTVDDSMDYEVELAVIIGKECKNVSEEEALDYVFGYSIFNDFSARSIQRRHIQWFKGKSLDTYSALGPCIADKEEIQDPQDLRVMSLVNGERRQYSHTRVMMSTVAQIIADLSLGMTLEAGDIIATGTPSGVAMGMENPVYLKRGDTVECRIEKIGSLINEIG